MKLTLILSLLYFIPALITSAIILIKTVNKNNTLGVPKPLLTEALFCIFCPLLNIIIATIIIMLILSKKDY